MIQRGSIDNGNEACFVVSKFNITSQLSIYIGYILMNVYECGIMDKLVYPNRITSKAYKSLAYGGRSLGGRIQEDNIQGGHIVQGAI